MESNTVDKMKQAKFFVLVEDIDASMPYVSYNISEAERVASPLNLIFYNDKDNGYIEAILLKARFNLPNWYGRYKTSDFKDVNERMSAAKDLTQMLRNDHYEAIRFIFWALFAVAVDKRNYDEKVSLIADFAYMIKIDEKSIADIIMVVKVALGEDKEQLKFQTKDVKNFFMDFLCCWGK
ncbi:hypothetical protein ACJDT4_10990 [Clostridium neuense]|uniref:Uncharacterized protein n=1 Tax=Clostridium neuense TaxID=1728934 RepID=A0ABW8TEU2_9CLOT